MQISKSQVTNENRHLTEQEGLTNCYYLVAWFTHYGFATVNAACAIAGNAYHEIHCNPGGSEHHYEPPDMTLGYGIIQWTPATKIFNYAARVGKPVNDMDTQLEFIVWESQNGHGYWPQPSYPIPESYQAFLASTLDVDYLSRAFTICAESRTASQASINERAQWSQYIYDWCVSDPPELVVNDAHRMKLILQWMATKAR